MTMHISNWTLKAYAKLIMASSAAGYRHRTVADYLRSQDVTRSVILRHDVDRFPSNALAMAQVEAGIGIQATYYFRSTDKGFPERIITAIAALGHEIGYHYEVMTRAHGVPEKALALLQQDLDRLRAIVDVVTTTAHGSPLSKWDNRSLWKFAQPSDFGLLGDGYRDIDFTKVIYFTDTGRTWGETDANLRDRVCINDPSRSDFSVQTIAELQQFITSGQAVAICLQTHPERWNDSVLGTIRSLTWDHGTNLAKRILRHINGIGRHASSKRQPN